MDQRCSKADRQRFSQEGAAARRHFYRTQLYDKVRHLDREAAIWQAYTMGREAAKQARLRQARAAGVR
jgi:hypothetical protein